LNMAFDNTNRGVLFKETRKEKDGDRDYSGQININGREFWLSGWVKTSAKGAKFLSLSVKAKDGAGTSKPNVDDNIPF